MTDTLNQDGDVDVAVDVARVVAAARYEAVAESDVVATKKLILDLLGAGVAGSQEPGCNEVLALMREFGGAEQASVIGGGKLPLPAAVTVNGIMARALELDDVSEQALIHTTASVVPAALAAAEYLSEPVDGKRLITAAQDNGVTIQSGRNTPQWNAVMGADGVNAFVNDVTLAAAGQTVFYGSYFNLLGPVRIILDKQGNFVAAGG